MLCSTFGNYISKVVIPQGGTKKKGINLVSCTVKVGFSIMFDKLCEV